MAAIVCHVRMSGGGCVTQIMRKIHGCDGIQSIYISASHCFCYYNKLSAGTKYCQNLIFSTNPPIRFTTTNLASRREEMEDESFQKFDSKQFVAGLYRAGTTLSIKRTHIQNFVATECLGV